VTVAQFNTDVADEFPKISEQLVAKAIRASGADVVGIEEGGGEIPKLARILGWRYYDVRLQIVSRLPLVDPPDGDGVYTLIEIRRGRDVAIENVHLPSDPYGPNWVRDGRTPAEVAKLERETRLPAIRTALAVARRLQRRGLVVFLTGDFNSPSFRDWTPATVGTRKFLRYPLRWPVSIAMERTGFRDSFRVVHPDPVAVPGITWPAVRTLPGVFNPTASDPLDRIDFVWSSGPARATASSIIGEPGAPGVTASTAPWPSDHRLVVSTFDVRPADPGTLVTTSARRVVRGDRVDLRWHLSGRPATRIGIAAIGRGERLVRARSIPAGAADGGVGFATGALRPGEYAAEIRGAGDDIVARYSFWVVPRGAHPAITTSRATYRVGQPLVVDIRDAPGDRWDWIGVYRRGADPLVASYISWTYTHATIDGAAALNRRTAQVTWPLAPGSYTVYLLRDDLYVQVARADFTVTR